MSDQKVSMADFESLLNEQLLNYRNGFDPGERVKGVVTNITPEYVILDVRAKREGLVPVEDLTSPEEGEVRVAIGDIVDVIFSGMSGGAFLFTSKISSRSAVDRSLQDAYNRGMPVEGRVEKEINGGYEVSVNGQRAFCPFSQINLFRQEEAVYIGKTFMFMISEYDHDERGVNVIVSRRQLMEQEREAQRLELVEDLFVGMIAPGTVTRIMEFGVFVDLGGAEGLIPLREVAWARDAKVEEIVKPGDKVEVEIKALDWDANRISLSLRGAQGDPWDDVVAKYPVGSVCIGKITKVERFGAFAEIGDGVEGLIPISKLGNGRRLMSAREVVNEGDEIELQVEEIDTDRRRISLKPMDRRFETLDTSALSVGSKVEGFVESIQPFGIFVRLSETQTGLLHISETEIPKGGNPAAKLELKFPPAEKITVVVKSIEGERISLTVPSLWESRSNEDGEVSLSAWNKSNSSAASLGSLGSLFDGL
ncbi:MAG: S1 RNA-binding domain-containing protein [Kiritimatiellia bacterium]